MKKTINFYIMIFTVCLFGMTVDNTKLKDDFVPSEISEVITVDGNGVALSLNNKVELTGVASTINFRPEPNSYLPSINGLQVTMIDGNNNGIQLFVNSGTLDPIPEIGDSLTVKGIIQQFYGRISLILEIDFSLNICPGHMIIHSSNNQLVNPMLLNTTLGESVEGKLVKVSNLQYDKTSRLDSFISHGYNIHMHNENGEYVIYIDDDTEIDFSELEKTEMTYDITGIAGQETATNNSPFLDGYRITPSLNVDIESNPISFINDELVSQNISLNYAYPNPFNPETTITYSLKNSQNVLISVYNSKGQLVQELINGNMKAGNYQVRFNAANLNSGVYYYSMKTDERTLTKKMILIK